MKDLPRRGLTAVIFAAVMLAAIAWSRYSFAALIFVIHAGSLYEYLRLIRVHQRYTEDQRQGMMILTMLLGCGLHASVFILIEDTFVFLLVWLVLPMMVILFLVEYFFVDTEKKWKNALLNSGGLIYLTAFLFCFYALVAPPFLGTQPQWYPHYASMPLGIVLLIWANDTFAYFIGSMLGKNKILPSVSPKKSWEGFIGGVVFTCITAWLLSKNFTAWNPEQWMSIAMIVSVTGTIGDFFESWLKRKAAVKDSGSVLPGHGGFLDRFDALIFCLPFVTAYLAFS
jgi:phosphatidate cytidylyltransferase